MPVAWPDLRDLAKTLASDPACSEVVVRASVSRAYYAAFHSLNLLCCAVPGDAPKHGSDGVGHGQAIQRLRDWNLLNPTHKVPAAEILDAKLASLRLRAALEARLVADYELDASVDVAAAQLQLQRVQDITQFAVRARATFDRLHIPYRTF